MKLTKSRKPTKSISAAAFDAKFDRGEDISEHLDLSTARSIAPSAEEIDLTPQKVNVDFPAWVVSALDREAGRIGIARQALIKSWIVQCLERVG